MQDTECEEDNGAGYVDECSSQCQKIRGSLMKTVINFEDCITNLELHSNLKISACPCYLQYRY